MPVTTRAEARRLGPPFQRFPELANELQMRIFKYAIKDAASRAIGKSIYICDRYGGEKAAV